MSEGRDIRICFVGDSFVNGTGDEEKLGWAGRLCALSQTNESTITYYNLGIRRNTSTEIKQRWKDECGRRLPEGSENVVVFSFGINDTVIDTVNDKSEPRVRKEKSIKNARAILVEASKKYRVMIIGPPPIIDVEQNSRIQELDSAFQALSEELSLPYLSVISDLLAEPIWLQEVISNDGAHPRSGGYAFLAQLVKSWSRWDF